MEAVGNLSNRQLDEDEKELLSLGMNFAIPQHKLLIKEIITSTESTTRLLDPPSAQELQECVKSCIDKYKKTHYKTEFGKRQSRALSRLQNDKSIVILPSDKGNATVVMNRTDYLKKIQDILDDNSYTLLKKDPTKKLEKSICDSLQVLEKIGEINTMLRKKIAPQHSYPPQL